MKKWLLAVLVLVMSWNAGAAEIAERLPESTTFYMEFDLGKVLELSQKNLEMVDQERAAAVIFQVRALRDQVKELLANDEVTLQLLDHPEGCKGYVVVLPLPEPLVEKHTYKAQKWDPKTGQPIEGEFEEHTWEDTTSYSVAVILETTAELAADTIAQIKVLVAREHEKEGGEGVAYTEAEVERGEAIIIGEEKVFLGRMDNLIVFSNPQPKELWRALLEPVEKSLAASELYKRYTPGGVRPLTMGFVNIASLVMKGEESLRAAVEAARKKQGEENGKKPEGGENNAEDFEMPGNFELIMAESALKQFLLMKNLFSLDKMRSAGLRVEATATENSLRSSSQFTLALAEGVGPVLSLLLNAGKSLEAPDLGAREGIAVMGRFGAAEMLEAVQQSLAQEEAASFQQQQMMMQMMLGMSLNDILSQLSGDLYMFVELVDKEHESTTWNRETGEMVTQKKFGPMPELTLLWGLKDREAFTQLLSKFFTVASVSPMIGRFLKKRVYQEQDVYIVGSDAGKEGADPDGLYNYAMAVVGRHLSFGSWKDMTALIRRAQAAAPGEKTHAGDAIATHPDANFIGVMPKGFNERLQQAMRGEDGKDPVEEVIKQLTEMDDFPIENEDLAKRIKETLVRLAENLIPLSKKAQTLGRPAMVVHGKLNGNFYEIGSEDEFIK